MIVREKDGGYLLIGQHEHALASGRFARHWGWKPRPSSSTVYAIANHDVGWREIDRRVLWNEEEGRPYSFVDYPIEPKLEGYRQGIGLVEDEDPYAGLLCSMHYASFFRHPKTEPEARFLEEELSRQERLRRVLPEEALETVEHDFRLLQLCDDLSLFICLNDAGRNDHPWYRGGFSFRGRRLEPIWEGEGIRISPNPFTEDFEISIPWRMVGEGGDPEEEGEIRVEIKGSGG
ncbi:MAG: DUF3891 family protein [Rubrobacteraceae bacterium]|nr:DUF3891 family protein [Rubrobacteraceae bacterium]MCL6439628.1 DUF3891 family protein [Rubrobacteraceae bacterium]